MKGKISEANGGGGGGGSGWDRVQVAHPSSGEFYILLQTYLFTKVKCSKKILPALAYSVMVTSATQALG